MKGMQLFDNYEEDGQLSLFSADYDDWDDDWCEMSKETEEAEVVDGQEVVENVKTDVRREEDNQDKAKGDATTKAKVTAEKESVIVEENNNVLGVAVDTYERAVAGLEITNSGPTVRVKYCASCGKLLFVKEETAGFQSECNNCGIKYFQKL